MGACRLDRLKTDPGLGNDLDVVLVTKDHGEPHHAPAPDRRRWRREYSRLLVSDGQMGNDLKTPATWTGPCVKAST